MSTTKAIQAIKKHPTEITTYEVVGGERGEGRGWVVGGGRRGEGMEREEGEGMRGTERMKSISEIMIGNFHEWLHPQVSLYF